jgi:hypothetical protein
MKAVGCVVVDCWVAVVFAVLLLLQRGRGVH